MADYTLNALHKAPLLDTEDAQLSFNEYGVVSSNPAVATVGEGIVVGHWMITGISAGEATVVVTRTVDGATVTHTVEVTAAAPFDWHIGPEQPVA